MKYLIAPLQSIHRQLILLGASFLIILMASLSWVMETNLSAQLQQVEARFVTKDMDRLTDLLSDKAQSLEQSITVWSNWDDAWAFMTTRSSPFIQSNFSPGTLTKAGMEFMTFWTPSGNLHYGAYEHHDIQMFDGHLPNWLEVELKNHFTEWAGMLKTRQHVSGLLMTQAGPMMLTIQPVVHSDGTGPIRGYLIAGSRLEPEHEIKEFSEIIHSDFELTSVSALDIKLSNPAQVFLRRVGTQMIYASQRVPDIQGHYAIQVVLKQPRTIYNEGKRNLRTMMFAMGAAILVLFTLTFGLVDILFIRRIRRLSFGVKAVTQGALPDHLPIAPGNDEIDTLTRDVKTMFYNLFDQQKELVTARLEAEGANMAKRQFLARMSHEIRTPLNGIIGTASLLETTALDVEQKEYLRMIQSSSGLLLDLVNDTLDFAKIEAGKVTLEKLPFNLEKEIQELIHVVQPRIAEKNLGFYVYLAPNVPKQLIGDPHRLRQILVNLLSNATKFTASGHIMLSVQYFNFGESGHQPFFNFVVEDTGTGIAPDRQQAVFREFEQANTTISRQYGGSGLGLAICKQLTDMMHGDIGVESQLGRGSRFWLNLPLEIEPEQPQIPSPFATGEPTMLILQPPSVAQSIFNRYAHHMGVGCVQFETVDAARAYMASAESSQRHVFICDASWLETEESEAELRVFHQTYFAQQPWVILSRTAQRHKNFVTNAYWLIRPVLPSALIRVLKDVLTSVQTVGPEFLAAEAHTGSLAAQTLVEKRILIVEDNAINQKVLERMLSKAGYQCRVAGDGRKAIDALEHESFDIVLMDCHMPVMDGFEATVKIRTSQQSWAQIPIVAVTGNAIESELEKCLACGMNDTLTKPIDKDKLFEKLNHWLTPAQD